MYGCDSEDNPHSPSPLKQKKDVQFLIITCLGFLLQLDYKLVRSSLGMLIIRKNEGNRAVSASNNHRSKPQDTRLSFA